MTRSCVEFSRENQVAAVRFAKVAGDIAGDIDYYTRSIGRHAMDEVPALGGNVARCQHMLDKARARQHNNLKALGDILADEDLFEGDEAVVGNQLYGLRRVGMATKFIGGVAEEVESFVAVPLGPAECPEDSDDDDFTSGDEVSEWSSDYNDAVRVA